MPDHRPLEDGDPPSVGGYALLARIATGGQAVVYLGRAPEGRQVAERGPLTGPTLDRLAIATSTALVAIHRAGVVHRDVKPANIVLGPDGPRVIDFGIARQTAMEATQTVSLRGTPLYMAPEQFSGQPATPACDVFAWAATMAFAATGRPTFAARPARRPPPVPSPRRVPASARRAPPPPGPRAHRPPHRRRRRPHRSRNRTATPPGRVARCPRPMPGYGPARCGRGPSPGPGGSR